MKYRTSYCIMPKGQVELRLATVMVAHLNLFFILHYHPQDLMYTSPVERNIK